MREYRDILDREQCNSIATAMEKLLSEDKLIHETDQYYDHSYGYYNLPEAIDLVSYIQPIIRKDYPNIRFENAYTRIYENGSKLAYHTDRKELYLTLSICVYSNIKQDWPLCISNVPYKGPWNPTIPFEVFSHDFTEYLTPVGSGVTCEGTTQVHWRNPLKCKPKQKVIQTFYHWDKI
jgi:hypothetical protein